MPRNPPPPADSPRPAPPPPPPPISLSRERIARGKAWFEITARADRRGEADIYLHNDIGAWGITSEAFVSEFRALGRPQQINLHINSMGGDVFDGFAIYNLLMGARREGASVTAWVDGIAASIASLIAMAGDEILMPENGAHLMIHDPSGVVMGTAEDMERMAGNMRNIRDNLVRIYAKRTGRSADEIGEMMAAETWMDGPQALAEGFVSRLLDVESTIAACGRSDIMNKFSHVPEPVRAHLGQDDKEHAPMSDESQVENAAEGAERPEASPELDVDALIDRIAPPDQGPQIHSRGEKPGFWQAPPRGDDGAFPPDPVAQEESRQLARQQRYIRAVNKALDAGRGLILPDGTNLLDESQQMIAGGMDPKDVPEALIKVFARKQQQIAAWGRIAPSDSGARVLHDYTDPAIIREQMSDAIAFPELRAINPSHKLPDNGARKFLNFTATDLMRECVKNLFPREDTRSMTKSRIVDEALGNGTSDFPNILGISANKVFLGSYQNAETTFRAIAAQRNLPNFQPAYMIRSGDFPTIERVNEHGEIQRGSMSESSETVQLQSHGKTIGVTRHLLINDNLGAFTDMAAQAGRSVAVYENSIVWAVVVANPTLLTPNAAMFSTTNGNLAGTPAAVSNTSLGVGRTAMRLQTSLDGRVLNVVPRILVVPATQETVAESILNPLVVPEVPANSVSPLFRSLNLVVEPILDGTSTTAWYLFSAPGAGANIVYGYLSGNEGPRVRTNSPFNVDGLEFQVLIDFYAAAIDFRFGFMNAGA